MRKKGIESATGFQVVSTAQGHWGGGGVGWWWVEAVGGLVREWGGSEERCLISVEMELIAFEQ